jgi:hypothetical protein
MKDWSDMLNRDYETHFSDGKYPPVFQAALNALKKCPHPNYVVGCFLAQRRDERYKQEGYTVTDGSIRRLVGKTRIPFTTNPDTMPNAPPGDDHGRLFLKDGIPEFYLSQPYSVNYETLKKIVAFCERWGLVPSIDEMQSNWFPSQSLAIRYAKSGETK